MAVPLAESLLLQGKFDKVLLDSTGLDFETQEFAGEYRYPEDRFAITSDWQFGDWGIHSRLNYIGKFKDWRNLSPDALAPVRSVSSFKAGNFQFTYEGIKNTKYLARALNSRAR